MLIQPAALPTELPGNLVQPKRAHSSINSWGGRETFLPRGRGRRHARFCYTSKSSVSSSFEVASVLPAATDA